MSAWTDAHCHLQDEFDPPEGDGPVEPHADRLAATLTSQVFGALFGAVWNYVTTALAVW